jgi:hypothetical protein
MQEAFPLYADRFPEFSAHASGMHQFVAWTALEAEGFGANLQVSIDPHRMTMYSDVPIALQPLDRREGRRSVEHPRQLEAPVPVGLRGPCRPCWREDFPSFGGAY